MLDEVALNQTLFLEFKKEGKRIAILPVSLIINIESKLRDGFRMIYGSTTLTKFKLKNIQATVKECQDYDAKNSHFLNFFCSKDDEIKNAISEIITKTSENLLKPFISTEDPQGF